MGQKVNPIAYRLPLIPASSWKSRWFTTNPQRYQEYLMADTKLRQALMKKLAVVASGWHFPLHFYKKIAEQEIPAGWEVDFFCISVINP